MDTHTYVNIIRINYTCTYISIYVCVHQAPGEPDPDPRSVSDSSSPPRGVVCRHASVRDMTWSHILYIYIYIYIHNVCIYIYIYT